MRKPCLIVLSIAFLLFNNAFAQTKGGAVQTPGVVVQNPGSAAQTPGGAVQAAQAQGSAAPAFQALPVAADGTLRLPIAANFSIQYKPGYKLLTVRSPWPGATKTYTYVLYPRASSRPAGVKADRYIPTPVSSVVSFSTTYIPALDALGELRSLAGVDNKDYIYNPTVRKLIADGKIVETTKNLTPDIERMIALKPDAIFTYGVGNEWDTHPKMEEAGLPVVMVGEWNEADPLARAEWLVFFAAFYDKEPLALAKFNTVGAEYAELKNLAKNVKERPTVLVDGPFSGTWSVPGGASYMARLLADAGASYLWADTQTTGSLTLSVEAVFGRALKAAYWLNPDSSATKLSDVRAMDPRFSSIAALAKGEVWNNNLRMSPAGGNDYYESTAMQPQVVLADLIAIFHPELLPRHVFTYYRKLGDE